MTNATSENEMKKIYEMEQERALVARQLNIAKGRQALTIKKLKQQGFEVLPVQTEQEQRPTQTDSASPTNPDSNEDPPAQSLSAKIGDALFGLAMGVLSAWVTRVVIDYSYPRLRRLVIPAERESHERPSDPPQEGVWNGQSIFK